MEQRASSVLLVISVFVMLTLPSESEESGVNAACPSNCVCNDEALSATCSNENMLQEVPITLNPRIERLVLKQNKIKTVDGAPFQFYTSLVYLDFSHNQLVKIPPKAFTYQGRLSELHLNHNKLSNITAQTFHGLKSLVVLNLRGNNLEDLPDKVFSPLAHLRELDLSENRIQRIDSRTFEGLHNLQILLLEDNQLTTIPTASFKFLPVLAELRIGRNSLKTLPNDTFCGLNSLTSLDLAGAEVDNISASTFQCVNNSLRSLTLADNRLVTVPTVQLSPLVRLEELSIGQNPFKSIPAGAFHGLTKLRKLTVAGASELSEVQTGAFSHNLNLETVVLSSNKMLTHASEGVLTGLPHLKTLVLRDNGFTSFKESLATWHELQKLDLSENPLECDCSIAWLRDLLLQYNTTHVLCHSPESLRDQSLRGLDIEDLGCSSYVRTHQTVIGAICGVVVALIAVLLFLMYRYRHKMHDAFKNYEWCKQTKVSTKQAEYQKTFNDDEFIIRTAHNQTLKPIPVTEL